MSYVLNKVIITPGGVNDDQALLPCCMSSLLRRSLTAPPVVKTGTELLGSRPGYDFMDLSYRPHIHRAVHEWNTELRPNTCLFALSITLAKYVGNVER